MVYHVRMQYILIIIVVGLVGWVATLGGFNFSGKSIEPTGGVASETPADITAPIDAAREAVGKIESQNGTSLSLSNQGLTKVPSYVFDRTNLTSLDVSRNALTGALQSEVQRLKNLRVLNLSHNTFTGVPAEVGQLTELEVLDLSFNPITGLPNELGNLKKLKTLDLRGTQYSTYDLDIIRKGLPATVNILVN